jgi:ferrous iron transport protein A
MSWDGTAGPGIPGAGRIVAAAADVLRAEAVARPAAPVTLDALATGVAAVVQAVATPAQAPEWAQWLDEIGFIPGERVMVTARGVPGGDPLVVRVGNSTFALRRAEAACIHLEPATP